MFAKALVCAAIICVVEFTSPYSGVANGSDQSVKAPKVFMSFSGGGYHAHAGASVMMMSLMDRLKNNGTLADMSTITENVAAISSNSGGSWFLTQAAYSKNFLSMMETTNASENFTSNSGYLGLAYKYITDLKDVCSSWKKPTICKIVEPELSLLLGKGFAGFLLSGGGEWDVVTRNSVFGYNKKEPLFDMADKLKDTKLSSTTNDWAKNKALVFASSLLTLDPALTSDRFDFFTGIRTLEGNQANLNYTGNKPGAVPVMFAEMGSSGRTAPNFLPGGDVTLLYGSWDKITGKFKSGDQVRFINNNNIDISHLHVIDIAANSSAAGGGFIDIPMMLKTKNKLIFNSHTAESLNGFAPAYSLKGNIEYIGDVRKKIGTSVETLADNMVVRFADGGFVDNTAVAYMVRHMQDNGDLTDGFNIVAMNNYPGDRYTHNGSTFPTSGDFAALFANPYNNHDMTHTSKLLIFEFDAIMPSVFEYDAYFTADGKSARQPDWEMDIDVGNYNFYLAYTNYPVITRRNSFFGITSAGVKGNLHVFSVLSKEAAVVPTNKKEMECYEAMLDELHTQVTKVTETKDGLGDYLQAALGL